MSDWYEDTHDAERLLGRSNHAACGWRASHRAHCGLHQPDGTLRDRGVDTNPGNLKALTKLSGNWIDRLRERQPMRELILDMDSSVSETYGEQEGTA